MDCLAKSYFFFFIILFNPVNLSDHVDSKFKYFIVKDSVTTDKQGLKSGIFIVKLQNEAPFDYFKNGEGPYNSIPELKKNLWDYYNNTRKTSGTNKYTYEKQGEDKMVETSFQKDES